MPKKNGQMKKKVILFGITCLALFIIAAIVFINSMSLPLRYYFHLGDRITGTLDITVSGISYVPEIQMVEFENQGAQRLHVDMSGFSIKGGEYGPYKISFVLENEMLFRLTGDMIFETYEANPILTFQYFNTNWWHVTEMTLIAEIILVDDDWVVYTKVVYREPRESGHISEYIVDKTFTYEELVLGKGTVYFGV